MRVIDVLPRGMQPARESHCCLRRGDAGALSVCEVEAARVYHVNSILEIKRQVRHTLPRHLSQIKVPRGLVCSVQLLQKQKSPLWLISIDICCTHIIWPKAVGALIAMREVRCVFIAGAQCREGNAA